MQIPAILKPRAVQAFAGRSDRDVARAMDRVLDAERAAQYAIAACATEGEETLAHARREARLILDRAHERIVALHTKAAAALEQVLHPANTNPATTVDAQQRNLVGFEVAIANLADSLLDAGLEKM